VVINPRGGEIGVAEPFLDFVNVSLIIERIRRSRRPA
jgi:hypothetical protein